MNISKMIPELNTALTTPLFLLEERLVSHCVQIEEWFAAEWKKTPPPVYGSIDLRNAGFKLAPIDMNLFPAGFNNLNPAFMSHAIHAAKKSIQQFNATAERILIIPENHTRNIHYWENIKILTNILEQSGFAVALGMLADDSEVSITVNLSDAEQMDVPVITKEADYLQVGGFIPDVILLNNDLSAGIPEILQNIKQLLIPPAELGWSQRLKSMHFQYYAAVAAEFSQLVNIDPWLIDPLFRHCGKIDFMEQSGLDCVTHHAEALFKAIKLKYAEYKIPYEPFLIIKADAGTYGMAVMTIRNILELSTLNRKQRTRMAMTKGGQAVNRVIIQEGVYTFETIGSEQSVAEPVVYLWGESVIGGFYRIHKTRGIDENLNAPGMHFEPMPFPSACAQPCTSKEVQEPENRLYTYGLIAKLSMLAAAREIKKANEI